MELDATTFVLEIINFIILVWVLKHFFYQPILTAIEKRRKKVEDELAVAANQQQQAEALKTSYESRLAAWEDEKRAALDGMQQEVAQLRAKRLRELDEELQQQRQKAQARERQEKSEWRRQAEEEALRLAGAFCARTLSDVSGEELDRRLRERFVTQFAALREEDLQNFVQTWRDSRSEIEVISAYELDESARTAIQHALTARLGPQAGMLRYTRDERLIAGLRIGIGGWVVQANLRDELQFFREAAHGD